MSLFVMVAKWARRDPLFTAKITESLPTPRTVRISAMVKKELLVAPITLLIVVPQKKRSVVPSHVLFFLILTDTT